MRRNTRARPSKRPASSSGTSTPAGATSWKLWRRRWRYRHFHACGCDRGTPGNDHIAWDEIATALKKVKYDGAVVIESFTQDVKIIAAAAAIWRQIEPSREEIATKGLKFLRKLLA